MIRHISSLRYLIVAALCFGLAMQVSGAFSKAPDIDAISKTHALAPEEVHGPTAKSIVTRLKGHYLSLDDSTLSERLLDRYLQDLDPNKIYFLSTDIKKIERYRKAAYEQIKKGDLSAGFDIFNLYQERVQERLDYLLSLLEDGLPSFDFGEDAELLIDREEAEWEPDVAALNHLWDQRLAHAIISMRLDGVSDEEVHKRLQRRYKSQKKRMQQNSAEDVFQFYMNALGQVYDPHTSYFTPHTSENFNINMSRSLEGIGAVLQADEEYTKIVSLVPGGPAAKGGQLQVADRIIGVGQEKQEIVNVIGWRLDEVVELIRGPKGTKVRLEVIPAGSVSEHTTREIEIERNKVVLEEQAAKKHYITLPATENEAEKRIAIITLPAFYIDFDAYHKGDPNYTSTTRDVAKLLLDIANDEEGIDGLIMDLRNNGGGSLHEANQLVSLFIPGGPTVQVRDARGRVRVEKGQNIGIRYDGPMGVLVNRFSASASEIFAGAMQDYGRALVLGDTTFGKGTVQALLPLNHGQLKLTQAKFYRVSGASNQNKGIEPDITFPFLVDKNDIGESALSNALPWDQIAPTDYESIFNFGPFLPNLRKAHEERISGNPKFNYVESQLELIRKQRSKTHVSLIEKKRQEEWQELNQQRLAIENAKRKALGEPLLKDIKELNKQEEQEEVSLDPEDKDPTEDPYLVESALVLADLIEEFQALEKAQ